MPPNSRRLVEEGAAIISFKLVRNGAFQVIRFYHEALSACLARLIGINTFVNYNITSIFIV